MNCQPKRRLRDVLGGASILLVIVVMFYAAREPQPGFDAVATAPQEPDRLRLFGQSCVPGGKINDDPRCIKGLLRICYPDDGSTPDSAMCGAFRQFVHDQLNSAEPWQ